MNGARSTTQQSRRSKGSVSRQLLFVGVCLFVLFWVGCTVTNKNYALLSKFFDGVPDPNAPKTFDREIVSKSANFSEHRPYIDDSCFECHTDVSDMTLSKGNSKMCLKCHDDIIDQYPLMHGAVTGVACLMCHNPHFSAFSHLLRDEGATMCTQCHELNTLGVVHSSIDPQQNCTDCHHAHGGNLQYFLHTQTATEQKSVDDQDPKVIDVP